MREIKGRAPIDQAETLHYGGRHSVRNVRRKIAERAVNNPPEPAGRQLGARCALIDGNDPAYFQRLNLGSFGRKLSLIVQNFKLRLGNLQAASFPLVFDFAIERHKLAWFEAIPQ